MTAGLTPKAEGADGGGRVFELPPVDGPCWTSDCLAISREWVAFKDNPYRASWNMIPYTSASSVRRGPDGSIVLSRPDGLAVVVSASVLDSLEACELLAEGLSMNPAVSPSADHLLQTHLEATRSRHQSSLARVHKVNRSGTTHTFYSMRGFHVVTGIVVVVFAVGLLVGTAAAVAHPHSSWGQGISTWGAIWSTALGLLFIWLGIRLVRVGVHISSEQMTIRGYLVTRKVNASEIRAITLQPKDNGQGRLRWIPKVELISGKSFSIDSFDCGPARNPPKPEMAATIEDVRTLLGVRVLHPDGKPGLSHVDRIQQSPPLQAHPASDGRETGEVPTETRPVFTGSAQHWHHAASKARWATIWLVASLAVTAGATAVMMAGYNPNGNSPTDNALPVVFGGLFSTWGAWRTRKKYKMIDQARKADELVDASDGTASRNDDRDEHPAIG